MPLIDYSKINLGETVSDAFSNKKLKAPTPKNSRIIDYDSIDISPPIHPDQGNNLVPDYGAGAMTEQEWRTRNNVEPNWINAVNQAAGPKMSEYNPALSRSPNWFENQIIQQTPLGQASSALLNAAYTMRFAGDSAVRQVGELYTKATGKTNPDITRMINVAADDGKKQLETIQNRGLISPKQSSILWSALNSAPTIGTAILVSALGQPEISATLLGAYADALSYGQYRESGVGVGKAALGAAAKGLFTAASMEIPTGQLTNVIGKMADTAAERAGVFALRVASQGALGGARQAVSNVIDASVLNKWSKDGLPANVKTVMSGVMSAAITASLLTVPVAAFQAYVDKYDIVNRVARNIKKDVPSASDQTCLQTATEYVDFAKKIAGIRNTPEGAAAWAQAMGQLKDAMPGADITDYQVMVQLFKAMKFGNKPMENPAAGQAQGESAAPTSTNSIVTPQPEAVPNIGAVPLVPAVPAIPQVQMPLQPLASVSAVPQAGPIHNVVEHGAEVPHPEYEWRGIWHSADTDYPVTVIEVTPDANGNPMAKIKESNAYVPLTEITPLTAPHKEQEEPAPIAPIVPIPPQEMAPQNAQAPIALPEPPLALRSGAQRYGAIPLGGPVAPGPDMAAGEHIEMTPQEEAADAMGFLAKNPENVGAIGVDMKGITYVFIAGQKEVINAEPDKWRITLGPTFFELSPYGRRALIEQALPQFTPSALERAKAFPGEQAAPAENAPNIPEEPPQKQEDIVDAVENDGEVLPDLGPRWTEVEWRDYSPKEIIKYARAAVDNGQYNNDLYLNMMDALKRGNQDHEHEQAIRILNEINEKVPPHIRNRHLPLVSSDREEHWDNFAPEDVLAQAKKRMEEGKISYEVYHAMRLSLLKRSNFLEGENLPGGDEAFAALKELDAAWQKFENPHGTPASILPQREMIPHDGDVVVPNRGWGFYGDGIRYMREDGSIYHYNEWGYRVWDRTRDTYDSDGVKHAGFVLGEVIRSLDNGEPDFRGIPEHNFTRISDIAPAENEEVVRVVALILTPDSIIWTVTGSHNILAGAFRDVGKLVEAVKNEGYNRDEIAKIVDDKEIKRMNAAAPLPAPERKAPAAKNIGSNGEPWDRNGLPKGVGYPLEKVIGKGKDAKRPFEVTFEDYINNWVQVRKSPPMAPKEGLYHALLLDNGEVVIDSGQITPAIKRGQWDKNRAAYYVRLAQVNGVPYGRIAAVGMLYNGKFHAEGIVSSSEIGNIGRKRTIWRYIEIVQKAQNRGVVLPNSVLDSILKLLKPIDEYIEAGKKIGVNRTIKDWVNDPSQVVPPWGSEWGKSYQPANISTNGKVPPEFPPLANPAKQAPKPPEPENEPPSDASLGTNDHVESKVQDVRDGVPKYDENGDPNAVYFFKFMRDNGNPLTDPLDPRFTLEDGHVVNGRDENLGRYNIERPVGGIPAFMRPFLNYIDIYANPRDNNWGIDLSNGPVIQKASPNDTPYEIYQQNSWGTWLRGILLDDGSELLGGTGVLENGDEVPVANHVNIIERYGIPFVHVIGGSHVLGNSQRLNQEWMQHFVTGAHIVGMAARAEEAFRYIAIVEHAQQLIAAHPEFPYRIPEDVLSDVAVLKKKLKDANWILPAHPEFDERYLDGRVGSGRFREGGKNGAPMDEGARKFFLSSISKKTVDRLIRINKWYKFAWEHLKDSIYKWEGLSKRVVADATDIAPLTPEELAAEAQREKAKKDYDNYHEFLNKLQMNKDAIAAYWEVWGKEKELREDAAKLGVPVEPLFYEQLYPFVDEIRKFKNPLDGLRAWNAKKGFQKIKEEQPEGLHSDWWERHRDAMGLPEGDENKAKEVDQGLGIIEDLLGKINDPHFNGGRPGYFMLRLLYPSFLTPHHQIGIAPEQDKMSRIREAALDDVVDIRNLLFFMNGNENILCIRGGPILAVNAVNDGRALLPNIKTGQIYAPGHLLPFYVIGDRLKAAGKTFKDLDRFAAIYVAGLGFPINRADMPEINEAKQKDMLTVMQNAAVMLSKYTDDEQRLFMQAMDSVRAYIMPLVTAMVNKGMIDTQGLSIDEFVDRYMAGSPLGVPDINNGDPLMRRDMENVSKEKVVGFMDGIGNAMVHLYKAYYENEFIQDFAEKFGLVSDTKSPVSFYNDKGEKKYVNAPDYILRQLRAVSSRNGPESKLLSSGWYRKMMYYSREAKIFTPNFAMINLPRDATLAFAHYGVHPLTLIQTIIGVITGKSNKAAGQMYLGLNDLDSALPKTTLQRILEYLKDNVLGVSESLMRNYSKNVAQQLGGSERDAFYALLGGTTDFTVHGSSGKVMNVEAMLQFAKAGLNVAQSWNNQFREMMGDFNSPDKKTRLNAYNRALYLILFLVTAVIFKTRQKQKKVLQDYVVDNKIPIEVGKRILAVPEGWNTGMMLENEIASVIADIKNGDPMWKIEQDMGLELFSSLMGYIGRDGDPGIKSIISTLSPTMVEPLVRAILNVQYGGRPIDTFDYGQAYTHFYDSTSEVAKKLCARLHAKDPRIDISPIVLEFVLKSYLGRYGQAISVSDDAQQPGVFNGIKNSVEYFAKQPYLLDIPQGVQTQMYQDFKNDYAKVNGDLTAVKKGVLRINNAMYVDLLAMQNVNKALGQVTSPADIFALATMGESAYERYVSDAHAYKGR
jgi:hypothetical protein